MDSFHNKQIFLQRRRELRQQSTPEEGILWQHARNKRLGLKFKRQYSIGPYIVDFYCPQKKLIVELDGAIHNEPESVEYDKIRNEYFLNLGYRVLRFWNSEIRTSLFEILEKIRKYQCD